MERPPMAEEVYSRDWEAQAREPQDPPTPPEADLAQGPAVWAEEAGELPSPGNHFYRDGVHLSYIFSMPASDSTLLMGLYNLLY